MAHCRFSCEKSSASPIEGKATFTMETSRTVMKKATQTSARAFQRRGSGAVATMASETYLVAGLFERANDLQPENSLEVVQRGALMCRVDARRGVAADGHFESRALCVECRLEDAHLGRCARHQHLLDTEGREQLREPGRLERRVGVLEHDGLALRGRYLSDEPARFTLLDRLADDVAGRSVLSPVVRVDDRRAAGPGVFEEGNERGVPAPVAFEQSVAVLVTEILEHVDEEEGVGHAGFIPIPSRDRNPSALRTA